jgi:two-component system NtrC family sensor kinase
MNIVNNNRGVEVQDHRLSRPASPLKRLIFGLVLMTLAVGAFGGFYLLHSRRQALQQAETTCNNLVEILQHTINAKIQRADLTVLHVVDEVVHQVATNSLNMHTLGPYIERQFRLIPELDSLSFVDAGGTVRLGSGHVSLTPVNITDRSYFKYLRDHHEAELIISEPVISKLSKKLSIICARRITYVDGAFGGVAIAVLPLQQFSDLFKGVPVSAKGSVSLRRDDHTLIARYSRYSGANNEAAVGPDRISSPWRNLLGQGKIQSGTYTSVSATDGVRRIYSYRRITPYPLYVNVGLAVDDVLADTKNKSIIVAVFFGFFLVTSCVLVWLVDRNWQQTTAAFVYLSEIAGLRERYRFLAENSADVIWSMDSKSGVFTYVSPAVMKLRGYTPNEVMQQSVRDALTPESHEVFARVTAEIMQRVAAGDSSGLMAVAEVEQPCKDGGTVWTEVTTNYILDEAGNLSEIIGISRDITGRRNEATERERLLDSLRESQELFALFMKYSPIFCFIKEITGTESRVLQVSDNYIGMVGIAAAGMIGKTNREIFPPDFAEKITVDDIEVVTNGVVVRLEEKLEGRSYITYKFPIETAGNRLLVAGYTIDITPLKQTEEALRNTGEYLEKIINYANAPVMVWDTQLKITRFNHAFEKMSGYGADEVMGRKVTMIFPEESREQSLNAIFHAASGERMESLEIPVRCKDGTLRFVLWNTANIYAAGGTTLISTVAQGQDITQRKVMEEVLQKQASVIKGVLESTDSAVFSVDRSLRYTSFNSAHVAVMKTHFDADIHLGESIISFMTGEDAAVARSNLERALSGEMFVIEADSGDSSRTRSIFEISHNPIAGENGLVEGVAVFARDVTKRKQSEQEFRDMQAQMMQNDKLATIGQLAAGVAHEINNPMGFVGSNMTTLSKYIEKYNRYIELLEAEVRACSSGELPEQIRFLRRELKLDYVMRDIVQLMDENNEGIERVKRIVQDLRTFSRADSSSVGPADLNKCMDSTINMVINEIKYVAELKREYGDLPRITCNSQQINQVFMNLLMNAAHAIKTKSDEVGEIVIRSWCDGDNVFVSVSDNGCGIPPENCSRIFDAFFTTKDVGKGTGLGLSISSSIVRKHDGEIILTSEVGIGTTFTVRLPIQLSQPEAGRQ